MSAGRSRSPVGGGAARHHRGKTLESSLQSNSLGRVPTSSNSSQQQQQQQQQRNRLAVTTLRLSEDVSFMRSARLQQMPPIRLHAAAGGHGSEHGTLTTSSYAAGRNNFSSGSLSHSGSGSMKTRYHDQQEKQDNENDELSLMTASVDSNRIHDTSILSSYQNFSAHTNT
jgi:hypothetical protein